MTDIIYRIWIIRILTLITCAALPVAYGLITSAPVVLEAWEAILAFIFAFTIWVFVAPTLAAWLDRSASFKLFNHAEWGKQKEMITRLQEELKLQQNKLEALDPHIHAICKHTVERSAFIINHGLTLNIVGNILISEGTWCLNVITDIEEKIPQALTYFKGRQPDEEELSTYFRKRVAYEPVRKGFFTFLYITAYHKADALNLRAA